MYISIRTTSSQESSGMEKMNLGQPNVYNSKTMSLSHRNPQEARQRVWQDRKQKGRRRLSM